MLQQATETNAPPGIDVLEAALAAANGELERLRAMMRQPAGEPMLLQRVLCDPLVLENLADVVVLLDRDQKLVYMSRTTQKVDGSDVLGRTASSFVAPECRARFDEAFEGACSLREAQTVEYSTLSGRSWLTRFVPIQRDGVVEHVLGATLETTERVREQTALRESDSRLRHAIDVMGMGTLTRNWATGVSTWDEAMRAILGVSPEHEASFHEFLARVHPEDRARVFATKARVRRTREAAALEFRIVRPSGEVRHLLGRASPLSDASGEAISTVGAVFDVTDRKRLEEQLSQRQKMEAVGELTSGIAHNFNNLLSVILPNLELCLEEASPPLIERLKDIEHATRCATDLVRQLMMFARNETDAAKVAVDLVAALRRIVAICQTTFDRAIGVELEIGQDVPHVVGNPALLEQVFLNICINSRDAFLSANTPEPRIRIGVERAAAEGVRIRLSDNGPGMTQATCERVFQPFFTTKSVGQGTGLGLATAYAIVRDHGGRIRCESEEGRGATFEIELPAAPREVTLESWPSPAQASPPAGSETILLVDDEAFVRRATRATLVRHGYQVLEAGGGEEALALVSARRAEIDLVVLDGSMPGLPGDRALARLRELAPALPVVLFSGQAFDERVASLADAALIKPIDSHGLLSTLRCVLDGRQAAASR